MLTRWLWLIGLLLVVSPVAGQELGVTRPTQTIDTRPETQDGAERPNHVLSLDGDGDYVEIVDSEKLNDIGSQVTIEAWIRPTAWTGQWIALVFKGDEHVADLSNRSYSLGLRNDGVAAMAAAPEGKAQTYILSPAGLVQLDQWVHLTGVVDTQQERISLLVNGVEVATGKVTGPLHTSRLPLRIGWTQEANADATFAGQMDEVRIWNVARTPEQIQRTMFQPLTGQESGLVGYWNFEGDGETVVDASGKGKDGRFLGDAHRAEASLPRPDELVIPTVVSGVVTDESGQPVSDASVRVEANDDEIGQASTDAQGSYRIIILKRLSGTHDLFATKGEMGAMRLGLTLTPGENQMPDLALKEAVSIEGTLLMPDDKTPHVAVPVEITRNGKVIDTVLSDEDGKYRFINLKPGSYKLRCQVLGGYVYYGKDGTRSDESQATSLQVRSGRTLRATDLRFPAFKKGTWRNYTIHDGLPDNFIRTIYSDPDGVLWVGTDASGVFRYDGGEMVNFTTEDGLANNTVSSICRGPDGDMWFGTGNWYTLGNGVSRYDGQEFRTYTTQDGLAGNTINAIYCDPDGILWFGSGCWREEAGGISRYDGKAFRSFTEEDYAKDSQSPPGVVTAIHRAPDGALWFGTLSDRVYQYDGARFQTLSLPSLPSMVPWSAVFAINSEPDGALWFGLWYGVYRYDGKELVSFTHRDGLAGDTVNAIHRDPDGIMWFGTDATQSLTNNTIGGISRYDGKTFVNYTTHDGLAYNAVSAIHRDPDGVLWFGTAGGLSRYDEKTFANITTRDGLAHNDVRVIHRDRHGVLWFGTQNGVSRYANGEFTDFPGGDKLANHLIMSIESDAGGAIWFGTRRDGAFRYDGKELRQLRGGEILSVHCAPDGAVWFGTVWGVHSYDGKAFRTLTGEDGLKGAIQIRSTPDGALWLGTGNGVYRYDGQTFTNFTTADGLLSNLISAVYCDPNGLVWFGAGGVSRYDGREIKTFTRRDGLTSVGVETIHRDPDGVMWFGGRGGVSAYDGSAWMSLDTDDGMAGDTVNSIYQDADGVLWFGTDGGVTQYRRDKTSPKARIVGVKTRGEVYTDLSAIPPVIVGNDVAIAYSSIDFKTIPGKRQYRYRIQELDSDWRQPTKSDVFDHVFQRPGRYVFQVQSIDRDLNYSESASLVLTVVNPFYLRAAFLVPTVGGGSILLIVSIVLAIGYVQRRRQVQVYQRYAARELQDARAMQMSLMPEQAPVMEGLEIAGKCVTANTVGGDFFDYLAGDDHRVGLIVADVSGKAMRGAMNAVMTAGIVRTVAEETEQLSPGRLMSRANNTLATSMESDMNVTMVIALLDTGGTGDPPVAPTLTLANAAHHAYPLLVRDGTVTELKARGLPLGMKAGVEYREETFDLQPGDVLVLMTDGIIEAHDTEGRMYGESGRLERLLVENVERSTLERSNVSAATLVDAILNDAIDFSDGEREDDMTLVCVRIAKE